MVQNSQSRLELLDKIKTLMILRLLVVTILFGMAFLISINRFEITPYYLVCAIYIVAIFWAILLNRVKNLFLFALIQIGFDVLFETGIMYFTNGIHSPLKFVYFFSIIAASIILYTLPSFMVATLSALSLGVIAMLSYNKLIPPSSFLINIQNIQLDSLSLLFLYLAHVFAFYLVAFLSGNLSERLRRVARELAEKRSDWIELKIFSDNILQSMNDGLIITNMYGQILKVNKAGHELLGQTQILTGKNIADLFPAHPVEKLLRNINLMPRKIYRFEEQYVKKDKSVKTFGVSASRLKNNEGKDVGIIILLQDLTEMKQMEGNLRRADRLAALGEMAAGMAHEIRNPLSSIRGSVEMLNDNIDTGDNNRLLNIILRESDRLNTLITEFLMFARPSPLKLVKTDINIILLETMELLKNHDGIKEKVHMESRFKKPNIPAYIDSQQIKQVFWNLCLNAIQSLGKNGGKLKITCDTVYYGTDTYVSMTDKKKKEFVPGTYAKISIQDNGKGIKPSQLENLFSPFYTTKKNGLGLGLAIAYRIVKKHHGEIDVNSIPGKGSTFNIYIPMFKIPAEDINQ